MAEPIASIADTSRVASTKRGLGALSSYASDPNSIIEKYLSPRGGGISSVAQSTTSSTYNSNINKRTDESVPTISATNNQIYSSTEQNNTKPSIDTKQYIPRYEQAQTSDITTYARPIQKDFSSGELYEQLKNQIDVSGTGTIAGKPSESYYGYKEDTDKLNEALKRGILNDDSSAMMDMSTGKVYYKGNLVDSYNPTTGKAYVGDKELQVMSYDKDAYQKPVDSGPVGKYNIEDKTYYYEGLLNVNDYGAITQDPDTGKIVVEEVGGATPDEMGMILKKAQAIAELTGQEILYNKAKSGTAQMYEVVFNDDGTMSYVTAPDMKDLYDKYMFFNDESKATDPNYIINEAIANIFGQNYIKNNTETIDPSLIDTTLQSSPDILTGLGTYSQLASILGGTIGGPLSAVTMAALNKITEDNAIKGAEWATAPASIPYLAFKNISDSIFGSGDEYSGNISYNTMNNIEPMLQSASYNLALKTAKENNLNFQQFSQLKEYFQSDLMNKFSTAILKNVPDWGVSGWDSDKQTIESTLTSGMNDEQRASWDAMSRDYKDKYIDDLRNSTMYARELANKLSKTYTESGAKTAKELLEAGTPINQKNYVSSDFAGNKVNFGDIYNMSPSIIEQGFEFMPSMKYDEGSNKLVSKYKTGRTLGVDTSSKKVYKVNKE